MEPYVFHSGKDHTSGIRVTVVGGIKDGMLSLAVSRCSLKDNFVKKDGREKALARLEAGEVIATIPFEKPSLSKFIGAADAVANAVIRHGVYQKVNLIPESVIFSKDRCYGSYVNDNYENGSENCFIYTLV
jgi:hypothetical protein